MNKEFYGLTEANLMRTLPNVLYQDEGMNPLGRIIAHALAALLNHLDYVKIYARIDQLEEPVLDALAKDFDVAWYDYNHSLETKRAMIKDSFFVHRHLGTKGALDRALSDIFPGSTVQEWFEYSGLPYYFRVVLDATQIREPAFLGSIKKAIEYYKSYRSHLEEDGIIVRISCGIVIGTGQGGIGYSTPLCGTVPGASTKGGMAQDDLLLETTLKTISYDVPKTGMVRTGTMPAVSTQGDIENGALMAVATADGGLYQPPKCGTSHNALK